MADVNESSMASEPTKVISFENSKEARLKKQKDVMNTTQLNYANMIKRLTSKKNFASFTLIYYSIMLIIFSLSAEFFPQNFSTHISSYFNIILSIIVLVYSLVNSNAHYGTRIDKAEKVLNKVKNLKRSLTLDNLDSIKRQYEEVIDAAEYRTDIDFFRTVKQKCVNLDLKWTRFKTIKKDCADDDLIKVKDYLSELHPYLLQFQIIWDYVYKVIIFLAPIILFLICWFI